VRRSFAFDTLAFPTRANGATTPKAGTSTPVSLPGRSRPEAETSGFPARARRVRNRLACNRVLNEMKAAVAAAISLVPAERRPSFRARFRHGSTMPVGITIQATRHMSSPIPNSPPGFSSRTPYVPATRRIQPTKSSGWCGRRERGPLTIDGHPLGATTPAVHEVLPANSGPGEIYPSFVDVPTAGCWQFDLRWATSHAQVELDYVSS